MSDKGRSREGVMTSKLNLAIPGPDYECSWDPLIPIVVFHFVPSGIVCTSWQAQRLPLSYESQ